MKQMLKGSVVRVARLKRRWNQCELARKLRVSQGYVSLVERGKRNSSTALARRLVTLLELSPTVLPLSRSLKPVSPEATASALGSLGYPGFAYLRGNRLENPAQTLLSVLVASKPEARAVEGLPWLLLRYPDVDWQWLVDQAKLNNVQNRLGYVVTLARELAERKGDDGSRDVLSRWESALEESKLAKEDAFGASFLSENERRWLRLRQASEAVKWNMLAATSVDHLAHA